MAEAVRERLHLWWIAEAVVVAGSGLGAACAEHEARVQLVGLRSCEVLRLDDEVVVGDLLLDRVDQVVLLEVRLAARLRRLSDHHAQALAVPRVRLEGLNIFEVDMLGAAAWPLAACHHTVALDRPQARLLPRSARSQPWLMLLLELFLGLLSHLQIHLRLLHSKQLSRFFNLVKNLVFDQTFECF